MMRPKIIYPADQLLRTDRRTIGCAVRGIVLSVAFWAGSGHAYAASDMTYAERLGWPAGSRILIFNVDDAGVSHASNLGTEKAIESGVAASVSLVTTSSWLPEIAAYVKAHPDADAGVHLTLNSVSSAYQWAGAASADRIPALLDEAGYLRTSPPPGNVPLDQVVTELNAQIDRAQHLGITVTHLSSKGALHFSATYLPTFMQIAKERHIPLMIAGGNLANFAGAPGQADSIPRYRAAAAELWAAGLPVLDDIVPGYSMADTAAGRLADLEKILHQLKPGVTEIILHCTVTSDEFMAIDSFSGAGRNLETKLIGDPALGAAIAREGIVLTNWRELQRRRDTVGVTGGSPR